MIYQDFNVMTNIDTAELVNIIPFKDDNNWYLKLIYEYENHTDKHVVVIPKAALPFPQKELPTLESLTYGDGICNTYISCNSSMVLYKSDCTLATERGIKDPAYYFDIVTESTPREMTIDEIEKELGYKVRIIG